MSLCFDYKLTVSRLSVSFNFLLAKCFLWGLFGDGGTISSLVFFFGVGFGVGFWVCFEVGISWVGFGIMGRIVLLLDILWLKPYLSM